MNPALHPPLPLSATLFLLLLAPPLVFCTDIKWHSGDNSGRAASAPRSQKYWDEHNIQRPDYAKTDAEVWAETMKVYTDAFHSLDPRIVLVTFIVIICAFFYLAYSMRPAATTSSAAQIEQARDARMKMYEAMKHADDDEGEDEDGTLHHEVTLLNADEVVPLVSPPPNPL